MTASTATRIVSQVREAGGYLVVIDGTLRLRNPRRVPTELRARIAAHKLEIIAIVQPKPPIDDESDPPVDLYDYACRKLSDSTFEDLPQRQPRNDPFGGER